MAKQVAPLDIKVGIQGLEELTRLKSAFKGLTGTIGITDDAINKATDGIKEYVRSANNSEAVIKGQVEAFRKLKSQADITGSTYKKLDGEIKRLEQELKGASEGLIRQRDALVKSATSTKNSSAEVAKYIAQLKKLQGQTRVSSQAFNDLEADIESLTFKMRQLRQEELADFGKNAVNATKGAIGGLQTGIQQSINLFKRLGEQSKTAFGQVARTVEGITAVGVGGAVAGGGAGALGGLSGLIQGAGASLSGLKGGLGAIPFAGEKLQALVSPDAIARLNEAASNVAALQAKVAGLDQAMDAVTTAFTAFGPAASAGAIAASAGIAIIYDRLRNAAEETRVELEKSFTGIDDEVQGLIRSLTKLRDQIQSLSTAKINELLAAARQRFAAAPAGTPLSRSMASQIAGLEAIGREEAGRQAVVLEEYRQRVRGTSEAAVDLAQRLSFLKGRLQEVDTSTTEGKAEFARLSNESVQLSEQIRKLGDSYRYVSQMATQAATAQENAANAATRANYFNRAAVRAQEQALADLGQRVRAGVSATPLALPAAGGTTAAETGAAIGGGARRLTGQVEMTFDVPGRRMARTIGERAGYYNPPTAATGAAAAVGQSAQAAERARKSYSGLLVELRDVLLVSNNSVSSLEAQRAAWAKLRNAVDPASKTFENAGKKIEGLDARLTKLQSTQQRSRRFTGLQAAQAAGAALSGGIFGGPEGFLGGAIGSAFGVGGAFAGAAIGAQVGGLRQQLGGFADYAAQLQKLQIALENVSGSQVEYARALGAAEDATRSLNVPQDVAIQGITKLTAAVKGAGGQVSDAELVFKNITAAIKGTGGSAEDVDGAITALTQVFSKGKVSAEELSGQLGERLPGAVTKFAKANELTLPELQKALEQGQVGLNELLKFIVSLGDEYSGVAQKIAGSSQDAGARLTVAFNDARIAIGAALQPIGAEFQEAFADFIENITPTLVDILPKIAEVLVAVAKNFDTAAVAAAAFGAVIGVSKITAIISSLGGLANVLTLVKANAVGATGALQALNVAALVNPWVALAAGVAAAGAAIFQAQKEQARLNETLESGSTSQLRDEITRLEAEIKKAEDKAKSYGSELRGVGRDSGFASLELEKTKRLLESFKAQYKIQLVVEQLFTGQNLTPDLIKQGYGRRGGKATFTQEGVGTFDLATGQLISEVTDFPSPKPDGAGSKAAKAKQERESQLPQLLAELAVQEQIAQINGRIREAELGSNELLKIRLEGERQLAEIAGQIKKIDFEKIPADEAEIKRKQLLLAADEARADVALKLALASKQFFESTTQPLDDLGKKYQEQIDDRARLKELISTGITEALALEYISIEKIIAAETERLNIRAVQLESEIQSGELSKTALANAERELEIIKERLKLQGGLESDTKTLARQAQPEQKGKLQQFIEESEANLKDLEGLAVRVAQGIGDAVGNAFASGITDLIEGTKTAKEVFADFLKSIAQILAQEGAKIIATYIAIGIAKAFAGFASASTSATGPNPGGIPSTGNVTAPSVNGFDLGSLANVAAKGAYFSGMESNFAENTIKPFAKGGIVNRPTFFQFAKGGSFASGSADSIPFQLGLMGEAGPEAIMPLERGPDGKLGVRAFGSGQEGIVRRFSEIDRSAVPFTKSKESIVQRFSELRGSSVPFTKSVEKMMMERSERETVAAINNPKPLDVRFESQVINGVEYVTAEQHQRGMAQAAERGRALTLQALQNSVKTRKQVGMA